MRSAAKHRSDSAARSTPTRSAAKGHAQKIKINKMRLSFNHFTFYQKVNHLSENAPQS
ncbi:MAG: hypothetical protein NZ455_04400 [Bacteroidia bacterium]|nr:hypothetical protein [Bacteroidia bacterium]MDW8345723.1 hypothetical protein [Bacteroidia bacterium]